MRLTFVQVRAFADAWKALGLSDHDLQALEASLLASPNAGAVMPGCGGMRKLRFAPPSWHGGKRGATRVIYGHFVVERHVYLILIYAKNERANLDAQQKKRMRELMREIREYLEARR